MKRNISRMGLSIVFAASVILSLAAAARAEENSCSLTSAAGKYSFTDDGTVLGIGPRKAVGVFTLQASGKLTNGVATSSLNGSIAHETFSGSYTVNADCTGTITVQIYASGTEILALTLNFAFDAHMNELRGLFTSATAEPSGAPLATVISLDARRQ